MGPYLSDRDVILGVKGLTLSAAAARQRHFSTLAIYLTLAPTETQCDSSQMPKLTLETGHSLYWHIQGKRSPSSIEVMT